MNTNLKALASLVLMTAVTAVQAQTASTTSTSARKTTHKAHKVVEKKPTVESQIEAIRRDMDAQRTQIDSLKQQLSDSNSQLQQAQQAAAAAQASAAQAQQAAQSQQAAIADTTQSVSSLQGAVADLKGNNQSLVTTIQDEQAKVKKAIESPDTIHYRGITISPRGSFVEAATVYRSAATGGDINTPFTSVPLDNSNAGQISEFFGSGRQSRIAIKASGKASNATLTGYYEADWLGTGITSNDNQSNSYVMRQRQIWAQIALNNGWQFTGGQMWSLATETTHGVDNGTEILPGTIDPQYTAGFVWARQYGFRVAKNFGDRFWIGASAENPETLNPAGAGLPLNLIIGSAGVGGGLYNATANYSFNLAPDMLAKIVYEPKWGGHYELFGISRFFRDRIFPNASAAGVTSASGTTALTGNSAGAYNDSTIGGAVGASGRTTLLQKKLTLGLKGIYGEGTGRYGTSTIADITLRPDAQIAPLHNFSALGTVEANPTKRLNLYFNYGGDYVGRRFFGKTGYGSYSAAMTGCNTEPLPGAGAAGAYGGGGTGFSPSAPGSCAGNNKDVQEVTAGYWYNIYDGPMGRIRQGIQYSYFERNLWSGVGGPLNPNGGAKGTDNVFETSFRYYLP
jgi:hypothetical protein